METHFYTVIGARILFSLQGYSCTGITRILLYGIAVKECYQVAQNIVSPTEYGHPMKALIKEI